MQTADVSAGSNQKATKLSARFTTASKPFAQIQGVTSLNYEDFIALMKKKQAGYQKEYMIQDAQRVHNIWVQAQEKQKAAKENQDKGLKKRVKRDVMQLNRRAIRQFELEWNEAFEDTIKGLEQIQNELNQQHEKQIQKALVEIEEAKNGKNLQKMKFSGKVLELDDQLRRLLRFHRYDEAHVVNNRLEKAKKAQMHRYISQSVDHSKKSLSRLKKKQEKQRQLFEERMSQLYKKQKRIYQNEYDKLVKNARSYEINPSRLSKKIQSQLQSKDTKKRSKRPSFLDTPIRFEFEDISPSAQQNKQTDLGTNQISQKA